MLYFLHRLRRHPGPKFHKPFPRQATNTLTHDKAALDLATESVRKWAYAS